VELVRFRKYLMVYGRYPVITARR